MLIHISRRSGAVAVIEGDAHVIVALDPAYASGGMAVRSFMLGEVDSSCASCDDLRGLELIRRTVGELREQLAAHRASATAPQGLARKCY